MISKYKECLQKYYVLFFDKYYTIGEDSYVVNDFIVLKEDDIETFMDAVIKEKHVGYCVFWGIYIDNDTLERLKLRIAGR